MLPRPRLMFSLRYALILLTAIGLLPLALLGAWNIHAAGQYKEREQERWMLDLARALSSAVDAELDSAVTVLNNLGGAPSLQNNDLPAFYSAASTLVATQPDWLGVILTDDTGKILFRTMDHYGAAARDLVDRDSLQQLLTHGKPVAGSISRGPRGRTAFPVRVAVGGGAGQRYTLTAVILPDRMVRLIARQQVPANAVIAVRDGRRLLVARSQNQERKVGDAPSPSLTALMQSAGPEGYGNVVSSEGMRLATGYTTRSRYGWAVVVGQPADSLRDAAFERMGVFGVGIVLSLLACIAAASLLANRLVGTIQSLRQNAAALGSGAPLALAPSAITEIEQIGLALEQAERQRTAQELERAQLLDSLNRALSSHQTALAEAREAGRAKDEFLAMLGHELRNPLSPIVTSLDLLDLRDEPSSRKERRVMRRQVNHLRRLVDDLLDVSRITSGKLQLEARAVNLADVARHAVASMPGQPITLNTAPAVWVHGDDSRLAQVLNNLLSNADRFGSGATQVTLAADATHARLTVSDNGIGMSEELMARVFEPFQQAPQSLARRSGGLGLGLAIVRKIVDLHDGQVSARSAGAGLGSQFEVVLPLCAPPAEEAPLTALDRSASMQLLLVDDNVDAALAGAALLELLGHEVRIAHTAAEALDQVRHRRPQVAILDIGLPDMDGYALAAAIREATGDAALRLVALTGYGQQEDVVRAYAARFDLHLTKPATVADLQRATAPLA
ncbi:hybrid sensor histidine kinase/response regulator [Duganella radicis]|uniref:histidine kinase n=1 Tax=Duganella radicis TaxID=551988 RepID=A0A6L6PLH6_9BURK|nr:ATP-binding protein [Duganella radicis]MTV39844.1 response regulator [Duganella radicis]